jgi:hypothetical protein
MQNRRCTENIVQEDGCLAWPNPFLTLGGRKAVSDFGGEDVRCDELVKVATVLIA